MSAKKTSAGDRGLFTTTTMVSSGISNTGSSSQSVEQVTGAEKSFDYEVEIGEEGELKVGGATIGASYSFCYGHNATTTISSGIAIEGEVPDIPVDTSNAVSKTFTWGLFMYPVEETDLAYNLVTYWTQTQ
jgi:hypothetical protein